MDNRKQALSVRSAKQRPRLGGNGRSFETLKQKQDSQASSRMGARKSNRPVMILPRLAMDELVAPRLTEQALSSQTTESFHGWLMYYFPRSYSSFSHRVDTNWMDFLRGLQPSIRSQALMWAVRALVTFQMGTLQGNANAVYCARSMYGRGVRCLRSLLSTPFALVEESLAASVLLGGYEILDGSSEHTWISHTRGIRQIMCARGAAAHKTGISRTVMLSFRPFLVAESFVLGEPCFLGEPDWISITNDNYQGEQNRKMSLGQVMDYAFNEITKCPGYYAATQTILASIVEADPFVLVSLLSGISDSKECLNNLKAKLLTISENEKPASTSAPTQSIPPSYTRSLAQLTCGGIESSLAMLDQLTNVLESDRLRRGRAISPAVTYGQSPWQAPSMQRVDMGGDGSWNQVRSDSAKSRKSSSNVQSIGDRLDKFSLNMGVASMSGSSPIQAAESGRFMQPPLSM